MRVWINGSVCDEGDARVSPFDHGLLTGDGVFETMRVYRGQVFALTRHLERLVHSAKGLGLSLVPPDELRTAVDQVIAANGLQEARVRITVTGGPSPLGSERGTTGALTIVAGTELKPWPPTADVVVVPWPRNERGALAGLKTTSYGENVLALAYARERGAAEGIFADTRGRLCEGTGTNIFLTVGDELVTPPLSSGCLAGVTRGLVLEVTDAIEAHVKIEDLAKAREAFLTGTTREVQPIRAVDDTILPAAPGPRTEAAAAAFTELLNTNLDP